MIKDLRYVPAIRYSCPFDSLAVHNPAVGGDEDCQAPCAPGTLHREGCLEALDATALQTLS